MASYHYKKVVKRFFNFQPQVGHRKCEANKRGLKYFCEFCPETLTTILTYQLHANQAHADQIESIWSRCHRCWSYFSTENEVTNHPCDKFALKLRCDVCDEEVSSTDFVNHANEQHRDVIEKTWLSCSKCPTLNPNQAFKRAHFGKVQYAKR